MSNSPGTNKNMKQPNIIFILVDDMGWRDLSCYGSTFYQTPNIDRLFNEGMHFTDAYAACPVCSPTRASILTGKYPATLGLTHYVAPLPPGGKRDADGFREGIGRGKLLEAFYIDRLSLEETSIASALREGGYKTWHVGKWHLGPRECYPDRHGFDVNIGGCSWGCPRESYFSPWNLETLENGPDGQHLTDRLADESVKLIENNDGAPFFLNWWTYLVHTPLEAKAETVRKYEQKARDLSLDKVNAMETGDYFPVEGKKELRIQRRTIQSDPVYAAMVEHLDDAVGRVMAALEKSGQSENTVIFFTSDNGGLATAEGSPTSNLPLAEGKGWMFEGGVREPLIAWWPNQIEAASECQTPVSSPDFYPTLLEIAGLPLRPQQHCDGISLLPLLRGDEAERGNALYWHFPHYGNQGGTPGSSIRDGDWKLIEFFEDGHVELYNLRDDIGETRDLAGEQPHKARELRERLTEWRARIEARMTTPNPDYVSWRAGHSKLE